MTRTTNTRLITALLLTISSWQAHADTQLEWESGQEPGYKPDVEATAHHCELFVDNFSLYSMSYRGARASSIDFEIVTRPEDEVINVGGLAWVQENSYVRVNDERETFDGEKLIGFVYSRLFENRGYDGRAWLQLKVDWDQFGNNGGTRDLKRVNLFVDIRQDGQIKRLWLNENGSEFTRANYDQQSWPYSAGVPLGYGYKTYLFQDSGSPLFHARNSCL